MYQDLGKLSLFWFCSFALLLSCSKADDPSVVDVKNLKYPHTLSLTDLGGGKVRLTWNASNFEEKFEGYNVYGVAMTDATIASYADKGLAIGKPLQLLDDKGEPLSSTKEILAAFNYDFDHPLTKAKAGEPSNKDDRKISYLPIHELDGDGDPVLPTCYPKASGTSYTCTNYTDENQSSVKAEKGSELFANGYVTYDVANLTPGTQYCFLIFSVQEDGKGISQTSTNFECVTPAIDVNLGLNYGTIGSASVSSIKFDVGAYKAACSTTCPDIGNVTPTRTTDYFTTVGSTATSASAAGMYFEKYSGTDVYVIAGDGCGVLDMGVRSGLSDATLTDSIPLFGSYYSSGKTPLNANGYSPAGASMILVKNHAYVVACTDSAGANKAFYHTLWVSNINTTSSKLEATFRTGLRSQPKSAQ